MKPFDAYEIHGCQRLDEAGNPDRCGAYAETCPDRQAMFWTLYGHIPDEGVMAIGDYISREAAEEVYCRIAGERVNDSLLITAKEEPAMAKQNFIVTAQCNREYYSEFDVEAASPEEALAIARERVSEQPAFERDSSFKWDAFYIGDEHGNDLLRRVDPALRLGEAATRLVEAIDAIRINSESEGLSLYECLERYGIHGLEDELAECEAALQEARLPTKEAA